MLCYTLYSCKAYYRYADQALRYRRKIDSGDSKQDDNETSILIKELANSTGDRERIRDELLGLLLAGRDTTASLLSSLFFCLAKRPDVWDKVREEVANELPNGSLPTYDQLKSIKYARYCINESKWLFFFFFFCPLFPTSANVFTKQPFDYIPQSRTMAKSQSRTQSCPVEEGQMAMPQF